MFNKVFSLLVGSMMTFDQANAALDWFTWGEECIKRLPLSGELKYEDGSTNFNLNYEHKDDAGDLTNLKNYLSLDVTHKAISFNDFHVSKLMVCRNLEDTQIVGIESGISLLDPVHEDDMFTHL